MPSNPAAEIARLREEIRHHDRKYSEGIPEITDLEYDRLLERLKRLEAEHPELITPDSPTQRVGDQPVEGLQQVAHRVPMLSIENTYSIEELKKYGDRVARLLVGETVGWVVELKVDGVAVSLIYEDGRLMRGVTRGNGRVGDDITHNIRTIRDVPLHLSGRDVPPLLEVRGEVYMTNSDLVLLNESQKGRGLPPFANTRNVTAGSIRVLDPKICAERRLRFFCHSVGAVEGLKAKTHIEFLEEMRSYGLPPTPEVACFDSFAAAVEHCEQLVARLYELDFEIDGLVLKVNRFDQRERLGSTSKAPRWVIAYKFEKYEATTRLKDIQVQVGKSGAITPVAVLEPVEIAGSTISQASLHNIDEINKKDIRIGDVVVVEKAGKIIPHVVRVEKHERKGLLPKFAFPTRCPACQERLITDEGKQSLEFRQTAERIQHYLKPFPKSTDKQNIRGLGPVRVPHLVTTKRVEGYGDLYRLKPVDFASIKGVSHKGANAIVANFEQSKQWGLERVLAALAIDHVGPWAATRLAAHFQTVERIMSASEEEIGSIEGIPPVVARSVKTFFDSEFAKRTIQDLISVGVSMRAAGATRDRGLVRCPNENCPAKITERLLYYASRNAMDIDGLGDKLVEQLVAQGLVRAYGDLYRLKLEQLMRIEGLGRLSSENLLAGIEASKKRGLSRLLNALSIPHVGARIAGLVAQHFGSMAAVEAASIGEIKKLIRLHYEKQRPEPKKKKKFTKKPKKEPAIIANSIYQFVHSDYGLQTISDLMSLGLLMEEPGSTVQPSLALSGKTLVVTGTLPKYKRGEIEEVITHHGGRVASGVSKNTDYVVAGENPGSKLAKAQELGVPVITEDEFDRLLKG